MSASSPREGNNTGRWLLVMMLSAILIAFIIIQPMPSFGNDLTCGNAQAKVVEIQKELQDTQRTDFTSGPSGGQEYRAKVKELNDELGKAYGKVVECKKEKGNDNPGTSTTVAAPNAPPAGNGTPGNPYVGTQGNTNPVLSEVRSWTELVKAVEAEPGGGQWYKDGLQGFNGISWAQVQQAAALEQSNRNWESRFILISNDQVSDSEARAQLKAQGVEGADHLAVVRVNGFTNTRGLPNDQMSPFDDERSQVRVSLALPLDWNDLSKGLESNRGVLTMCGNGWKLKQGTPSPAPSPMPQPTPTPQGPTPTAPPATPTTRPYVPPTTAPPTTQPPRTTTTTRPPTTTTTTTRPSCPPGTYWKDGRCQPAPISEA